jgi:hypothetical protein
MAQIRKGALTKLPEAKWPTDKKTSGEKSLPYPKDYNILKIITS